MDSSPSVTSTAEAEAKTIDITTLAYSNFINTIKSETTKERYVYCLKRYLKFLEYSIGYYLEGNY
jgi:hypothetical protein